jgi:hypothetical protein
MSRRGPKTRDTIGLVERVVEILADDPTLTANAVVSLSGGRRKDVLRVVRTLRRPESRFPICEKGAG